MQKAEIAIGDTVLLSLEIGVLPHFLLCIWANHSFIVRGMMYRSLNGHIYRVQMEFDDLLVAVTNHTAALMGYSTPL